MSSNTFLPIIWKLLPANLRHGTITFGDTKEGQWFDLYSFIKLISTSPYLFPIADGAIYVAPEDAATGGFIPGNYLYAFSLESEEGETPPTYVEAVYNLGDVNTANANFFIDFSRVVFSNIDKTVAIRVYRKNAYENTFYLVERLDPTTTSFIDTGTNSLSLAERPKSENTSTYNIDITDTANTLQEIKAKIDYLRYLIDIDLVPPSFMPYLGWMVGYYWNHARNPEAQRKEMRMWMGILSRKGTIPGIVSFLKRYGATVADVYEPYQNIARYSDAPFSGSSVYGSGVLHVGLNGTLADGILVDNTVIFEDFDLIGAYIKFPDLLGPKEGFKVSGIVPNPNPEGWVARPALGVPLCTATANPVFYVLYKPEPFSNSITNWTYFNHGTYEVITDLPVSAWKEDHLALNHPAGTRMWINNLLFLKPEGTASVQASYLDIGEHITDYVPITSIDALIFDFDTPQRRRFLSGAPDAYGFDIEDEFSTYILARRNSWWTPLLFVMDMDAPTSLLNTGDNTVVDRPEGYLVGDDAWDIQPQNEVTGLYAVTVYRNGAIQGEPPPEFPDRDIIYSDTNMELVEVLQVVGYAAPQGNAAFDRNTETVINFSEEYTEGVDFIIQDNLIIWQQNQSQPTAGYNYVILFSYRDKLN